MLPMRHKYVQIAELLKGRIRQGDYAFTAFPGAHKIAKETGCSYLTVRQAVQRLLDEQVLRRLPTGRLEVCETAAEARAKKVALIRPSWELNKWDHQIYVTAKEYNCQFQTVFYSHLDDPVIFEALDGDFDLLIVCCERTDSLFIEKLKRHRDRVITLFTDLTGHGLRCLNGMPPAKIHDLIAHLRKLGHRRIACFNSHPVNQTVQTRIDEWQKALDALGLQGTLYNYPCEWFSFAYTHGRQKMSDVLAGGKFDATAIFCPSTDCAIGVLRALHDHGLKVPREVSLCSFGDGERAAVAIPAITVIDDPDIASAVRPAFAWFCRGQGDPARLLYTPAGTFPIRGETTAKPPAVKKTAAR